MSKLVNESLCPVMSGGNKRLSVSMQTCNVYKKVKWKPPEQKEEETTIIQVVNIEEKNDNYTGSRHTPGNLIVGEVIEEWGLVFTSNL